MCFKKMIIHLFVALNSKYINFCNSFANRNLLSVDMYRFFRSLCLSIPFFATSALWASNEKVTTVEQLLKDKQIDAPIIYSANDNEGGTWLVVGEAHNQVYHVSEKGRLRKFPSLNKKLSSFKITSLLPLKKELVLLGTDGNYLLCVRSGHYTRLDYRFGLTDSIINRIEINHDKKEVIVVGDKNRFVLNYLSSKEQFQFSKEGSESGASDDVIKKYFREPIQKALCDIFGNVDFSFKDRKSITNRQIAQISKELRAGDLLLKRNDYQLSNIAIPGFWTHSGIYLGSLKEMDKLFENLPVLNGIKASDYIKIHHYQVYRKMLYRHNLIFEAVGDGVSVNPLRHIAGVDYFVAIRPQIETSKLFEVLLRAFNYYDKPYDYLFDLESDDAMICSELIYKSLGSNKEEVIFKLSERNGEPFLSPSDIALQCINESKEESPKLQMVVYCGVLANSSKSAFQSFFAFESATLDYMK